MGHSPKRWLLLGILAEATYEAVASESIVRTFRIHRITPTGVEIEKLTPLFAVTWERLS
jgi:hypothetical protein